MPHPANETRNALLALPGASTDRARCIALGLPLSWRGTLGRIRSGAAVSLDTENEVRWRLGLPAILPPLVPVPPCPDCGSVHHTRCNGNGGPVVVLAAGEIVKRAPQKRERKRYWRPCLPADLQERFSSEDVEWILKWYEVFE